MPQAHHELHEEVHEVVGGENHGRVQRDHEAGPQRQVEIRSQLLHKGNAHTHCMVSSQDISTSTSFCVAERERMIMGY